MQRTAPFPVRSVWTVLFPERVVSMPREKVSDDACFSSPVWDCPAPARVGQFGKRTTASPTASIDLKRISVSF